MHSIAVWCRRGAVAGLVFVVTSCIGERKPAEPGAILAMRPTPLMLVPDTFLSDRVRADTLNLFRPTAVRWVDSTLYVCDGGNDRVRLFDAGIQAIATFGERGEGPGELRFPIGIAAVGGSIAVVDAGNGRVNRYSVDGTYEGEIRLPDHVISVALLDRDHVVVPGISRSEGAFALLDSEGQESWRGVPAADFTGLGELYPGGATLVPGASLIAVAGRMVVVVNNMTGVMGVYRRDGETVSVLSLPLKLLSQVFEYRRRVDRGFGARAMSSVYKDMVAVSGGRVLLLVGIPSVDAVMVDPASRSAVVVNAPPGPRGVAVRRASSVAVEGDRFVFANMDGLAFFRMSAR